MAEEREKTKDMFKRLAHEWKRRAALSGADSKWAKYAAAAERGKFPDDMLDTDLMAYNQERLRAMQEGRMIGLDALA
jgi:hypothetical protein